MTTLYHSLAFDKTKLATSHVQKPLSKVEAITSPLHFFSYR